jgi:sarcosine oxidase delta subunit
VVLVTTPQYKKLTAMTAGVRMMIIIIIVVMMVNKSDTHQRTTVVMGTLQSLWNHHGAKTRWMKLTPMTAGVRMIIIILVVMMVNKSDTHQRTTVVMGTLQSLWNHHGGKARWMKLTAMTAGVRMMMIIIIMVMSVNKSDTHQRVTVVMGTL